MGKRYSERAALSGNPVASRLFTIMEEKRTNLALGADLLSCSELLRLADAVGPHICVLKTHIDFLEDFTPDFIGQLLKVARRHNFLLFEDRKFADIGNSVKIQYRGGIYRIADWADIVNAHIIPGEGIIRGLRDVGLSSGKALLLIAEMSSSGSLTDGNYAAQAVEMARKYPDFVIGFISQKKVSDDPFFIHFVPGVRLSSGGDRLGQRYKTPRAAIEAGADIIIVGRGICQAPDPEKAAAAYKKAAMTSAATR